MVERYDQCPSLNDHVAPFTDTIHDSIIQVFGIAPHASLKHATERGLMNKFQAMAQIMTVLNEDALLKPGSRAYKTVRKMVSDMIDSLGPETALAQVMDRKAHLLGQIKILCMWHHSTGRRPSVKF